MRQQHWRECRRARRSRRNFVPRLETLEDRVLLVADLQGQSLAAPDAASWGSTISVQSQVRNAGSPGTGTFHVRWFLSQDAVGSNDDVLLNRTNNLGNTYTHSGIAAASSGPIFTVDLALPTVAPVGWSGSSFYIIMRTDAVNVIVESNENNNFGQLGNGIDREAISITAPEVTTLFGAQNIGDGDTSPSVAEGTLFGNVTQGSAPVTRTFTVRNDGNAPLALGAVSLPTGYSLVESLTSNLAAGASDTFTVRLDTAVAGPKNGQISFTTNDANENPFNFSVSGNVVASSNLPEVAVTFGSTNIPDNDNSPSTAEGTNFGSVVAGSAPISRTFTVRNSGVAPLALGALTAPAGFTITEGLPASLAAGASDTFTVRLDTATGGVKTGQISFSTNDADENPFNFSITGTVTTAPEITVLFGATNLTDGDSSPSAAEGTDFGSVIQGDPPVSRTFTVRNDGTANLTLGSVVLPTGFTLTEALATTLAPGASDTFTVRMNTTAAANRTGSISISNNDANENPFNFAIQGTIVPAVPEITVEFGGQNIVDNDNSPSAADGTDFGSVIQGNTLTRTFTVRNDGNSGLTLGPVVLSAGFTLTESLAVSLAPGASDTFTVQIDSATAGDKTGQISIATNDANENPFNFSIRGSVVPGVPEITVLFGSQGISDGDTTPSALEGTDFGAVFQGSGLARTFTVRNDGTGVLSLGPVVLPTGFTISEGLATSLAAGASDTFTVEIDSATLGSKSGEIRITTNDADENPFNFAIQGNVVPGVPEITVEFGGVNIADGDATPATIDGTDFGNVPLGSNFTRTFTVRNDGTGLLTLGTVALPTGFTLTEALASSLAAGASDTFTVRINSAALGTLSGVVNFTTGDADENPFNFTIQGTITPAVPEVAVEFGGQDIQDNDTTPTTAEGSQFGIVLEGSAPVVHTFTLRNTGSAPLSIGAVVVPLGFILTEGLASSIAGGASDSFTVELDTTNVGYHAGDISITTGDADENPFNFSIAGEVTQLESEVTVLFGDQLVSDNDTSASITDGTHFGPANGPAVSHIFTVRNDGTDTLTLGAVSVPAFYTLTEGLVTSLAPGASDTFTVRFDGGQSVTRSGTVTFTTSDADENPFNFNVTAVPSSGVELSGALLTVSPTSIRWGDTIAVQARITNTGTVASQPFNVRWYLSQDPNGSEDDDLWLGTTAGSGFQLSHPSIAAGATGSVMSLGLELPRLPPDGWAGNSFYLIMYTDSSNSTAEFNELDNFGQLGEGIDRVALAVDPFPTFGLNSLPGADMTIYLDFDGHTIQDPVWFNGGQFSLIDYDTSFVTTDFSAAELSQIQNIWAQVAEDFRPFNINVTTQDPGIEALRNTGGADDAWGVRIVITGSGGMGGFDNPEAVAGSFAANRDLPAIVFQGSIFGEINVAEAISHAAGRTLGLNFDGRVTPSELQFGGHGTAPNRWAPIMGSANDGEISQWSRGEYGSATFTEDDLAIITSQPGVDYRADDHANTAASATPLTPGVTSAFVGQGIIEQNTDVDFFSFTLTSGGNVTIDVNPAAIGPNLNVEVALFDASFNLLQTESPASTLGAVLTRGLSAGTYYLRIDGVGSGDPLTNGYSDYGSLGEYSIDITVAAPTADLVGRTLTAPATVVWGETLTVQAQVGNGGTSATGPFDVSFYLTTTPVPDVETALLLHRTGGAGTTFSHPSIAAGSDGAVFFVDLQVPVVAPLGWSGNTFYVAMRVDPANTVAETDETNGFTLTDQATIDPPDIFQRHSLPGASKVIYLDFDGHTTTNAAWNGGVSFDTDPYDADGFPASISILDEMRIEEIYEQVVADFLPFDVDVTTEDPGIAALVNSGGGDTQWGIRVVIGGDGAWYLADPAATGIAQQGEFGPASDIPAFVFSTKLSTVRDVAIEISHQIGHVLGLSHDGRASPVEDRFLGHSGAGATWGPIMGAPYGQQITQWSRGEYANANNTEDDLAIITTTNGFGYRADDHSNTAGAATSLLKVSSTRVVGYGIIEQNTDDDWFTFNVNFAGDTLIQGVPTLFEANLNPAFEIYDSSLNFVTDSDFASQFVVNLTPGTYYVKFFGAGARDPLTDGYSDYGSLGDYNFIIDGPSGMLAVAGNPVPPAPIPAPLPEAIFAAAPAAGSAAPNRAAAVFAPQADFHADGYDYPAIAPVLGSRISISSSSAALTAARTAAIDELMQQLATEHFDFLF